MLEKRGASFSSENTTTLGDIAGCVIPFITGCLFLVLIPLLHLGVGNNIIWTPDKPVVDRQKCKNTCFDTIFKGTYERRQEPGYKHVYFNITSQTLAIWTLTILHILFANESIRYILCLIYKRNLRIRMFLLCIINIYPNYYSFWALFNYFNDDFYKQLHHQLFFSITELIVTCLVLNLTNKNNSVISWKTYIIIFINSIHILIGGLDQFFAQLIFGEGIKTLSGPILKARDIGLFFPDVLHLGICLWEIYLELKRKDLKVTVLCQKREFIVSCMFAFVLFVMGQNL